MIKRLAYMLDSINIIEEEFKLIKPNRQRVKRHLKYLKHTILTALKREKRND